MKLLITIFSFEWIQLKRQPTQLWALFVFMLVGLYAIYSGSAVTQRQRVVIDTLSKQYEQDYALTLKKFADTLTPETKAQAAFAGLPQMINFRIPPLATDPPSPLAALSVGQRDINPYYQKVKSNVSFLDNQNVEISNPSTLFAGNFDLSFVLIYLLPLLIITLCYGSYAEEREQGTYALLSIQALSIEKVMLYKLLFRGTVVLVVVLLLCTAGFLATAATDGIFQWLYLTVVYLFFWLSVCYFFVQTKSSSIITALKLVAVWLFFLILLPSLSNTYLSLTHPIPLRADLASFERHISEEVWTMKPAELAAAFDKHNPQYRASINPAKDSTSSGPRFIVGYYDMLERKVGAFAKKLHATLDSRSIMARKLASANPSMTLQYLYNATARTGRADYQDFEKQISSFQKKWKHHLYTKQLWEKNFSQQELKKLLKFEMTVQPRTAEVLKGSLAIWSGVFLFLLLGLSKSNVIRKPKN
jgi:ABC-2 type transport system permease protein